MSKKIISLISTELIPTCHGLRSISSFLRQKGYDTKLIFFGTRSRRYPQKALRELRNCVNGSDLIGISCYSQSFSKALQVISVLKPLSIPIVWGGCHATLNSAECIKHVDIICRGEGEGAILELIGSLDNREKIKRIPNLWVKQNGEIFKNALRPLMPNLDILPPEDYEFNHQYFLESGKRIARYAGQRLGAQSYQNVLARKKLKGFSVSLSRGCPYACAYYYNYDYKEIYRDINNNTLKRKSVEAAIKEILYYKKKLNLTSRFHFISFDDDDFFVRPLSEIKQFSEEYRKNIGISFGCHVHVQSFNEEKLKALIDAGLKVVTTGLQTGSERINREIYNRIVSDKEVINVAKTLRRYLKYFFLPPSYHVINTNPYETKEDVWKTINLINELPRPFNIQIFQLAFFPNSRLATKAFEDKVVMNKKDLAFDLHYYDAISYLKRRRNYRYEWFLLNLMNGSHHRFRKGRISYLMFNILTHKRMLKMSERCSWITYLLSLLFLFSKKRYVRYHYERNHRL
ncbi:MAG: cobalamin-dependent protein [Candidatus Omnitrophica bacterium]|nr:cobalamin-dependent protein [Candidatus Omnitrophota bacterium]